jgi:hypothetical protein
MHCFIDLKTSTTITVLVIDIKKNSSKFIIEKCFSNFKFNWQSGHSVFSFSHFRFNAVCNYTLNREEQCRNSEMMPKLAAATVFHFWRNH